MRVDEFIRLTPSPPILSFPPPSPAAFSALIFYLTRLLPPPLQSFDAVRVMLEQMPPEDVTLKKLGLKVCQRSITTTNAPILIAAHARRLRVVDRHEAGHCLWRSSCWVRCARQLQNQMQCTMGDGQAVEMHCRRHSAQMLMLAGRPVGAQLHGTQDEATLLFL